MSTCPVSANVLTAVCAEAREDYRRTTPAPRVTDLYCSVCGARAGAPCTRPNGALAAPHRRRETRWGAAYNRWASGSERACDDAVNELCALASAPSAPSTGRQA
ncbi:hypothetical protein [Streptomyces parvulus]|uniref:hypothetical protein n=1 Tax=Streptomyces parvulus TaxID=146923 RepID=UPI00210D01B2|nr:hypothetical protein [Streptomyces parvulus]MCQ4193866.1 hypothetical protein [Streptomyces parvulus]